MRNPHISIITTDELVENIKKGLEKFAGSSQKYSLMVVKSFFKFNGATQSLTLTVPGIRFKHCQSCKTCDLCHWCKQIEPFVTSKKKFKKDGLEEEKESEEDMDDVENNASENSIEAKPNHNVN